MKTFSLVGRSAVCGLLLIVATMVAGPVRAAAATLGVSLHLTNASKIAHLAAGDSVGIAPAVLKVHVGDTIVFTNDDPKDHHTATGLEGAQRFSEPRWSDAMLKPVGTIGANPWSTGDLAPGARSAPMTATTPGLFLYGCFFHYSAGMRGEIIVEP